MTSEPFATTKTGELGGRIRVMRRQQRLTLRTLAERSGLSEGFLSQVERGRSTPSIASLHQIADALGSHVADFFQEHDGVRPFVLRLADRSQLQLDLEGVRKFLLTKRPLKSLEVLLCELEPGGSTGPAPYTHGDSEEFVLVLSGRAVVDVGGTSHQLAQGDCIDYLSSIPHAATNPGPGPAELLFVISPPSF